ncbi:FISUMP domain-containing protein [Emticicia sp. BO119]|uniref:FISUMP domain-containing protein n=1 Tax=Emticicia sp. BO119 TaxID=2757768 RepID=UPI0015F0A69C|nr:FISUMP domain-containing protein [Emticicia sp. BO119]MBA4852633.1 hypothetical protein [Emticicia sp. BO119]
MKKCIYFLFFVVIFLAIPNQSEAQLFEKMSHNNRWTIKNLNADIPGSYCYNDSSIYYQKYGRLYPYKAAQSVCVSLGEGWHLPLTDEWHILLNHYNGEFKESASTGKESFEKLLRKQKPNFGMTLAGNRNIDVTYSRIEGHGFYWTLTEFNSDNASFLNFANGRKVLFLQPDMKKIGAISVRCVKKAQW